MNSLKNNWETSLKTEEKSIETPKERYIFPGKQQQSINEFRLI